MAERGLFLSDWTSRGDLALAMELIKPYFVGYRFGLWISNSFRPDDRLWDMRYISAVTPFTCPVVIVQDVGFEKLYRTTKTALEFSGGNTIALDVEINFSRLRSDLVRLIDVIKAKGVSVILYSNHDFIKRYQLNSPDIAQNCYLWLAHYADAPRPVFGWDKLLIWQRAPKTRLGEFILNVTDEVFYTIED